ncbi:hypothetical protein BGZ83_004446 [Gryganskiella cystojenkinii]|nr:hypothetical protein BGZ83_004446 [Gryganskiella cystojenkinii]
MTAAPVQSLRSFSDGSIVEIDALWDTKVNSHVILWKQIEAAFDKPRFVRRGLKLVFFMLDENFEEISYHPGIVLDVYERRIPCTTQDATTTIQDSANNNSNSSGTGELAGKLVQIAINQRQNSTGNRIDGSASSNCSKSSRKGPGRPISTIARSSLIISAQLYESFLESINNGQATLADSIKAEFREHFTFLQSEIGENRDLQQEMTQMLTTMLDLQRQANERLIAIQHGIRAILTQTYELLEYTIPRLFIILPKESSRLDVLSPFTERFRLYFLCECGEHTKTNSSGSGNRIPHHIHMAKHEGYELEHATEFFQKYGPYILGMLRMLKLGVSVAGYVVPPLAHLQLTDRVGRIQDDLVNIEGPLEPQVDTAIKFLERIRQDGSCSPENLSPINQAQALEGAELRQMARFLRGRDTAMVLGNLYRITTSEGHVKWVCFDHYRENYNEMALKAFAENVLLNKGEYDEFMGTVTISLRSSSLAKEFYSVLVRARNIQEMDLTLDWDMTYGDLKQLRDALQAVNMSKLSLDCGNYTGPATDTFNRGKRCDPLVHIMMNTKLVCAKFTRLDGFFSRSSGFPRKLTPLREVHISSLFNPRSDQKNLKILLEQSPQLSVLSLVSEYKDFGATLAAVQASSLCHGHFRIFQLSAPDIQQRSTVATITKIIPTAPDFDDRTGVLCNFDSPQVLDVDQEYMVSYSTIIKETLLHPGYSLDQLHDITAKSLAFKRSQLSKTSEAWLKNFVQAHLSARCGFFYFVFFVHSRFLHFDVISLIQNGACLS